MMLFGPGVTVQTNANATSAIVSLTLSRLGRPGPRVLYDFDDLRTSGHESVRAWRPPVPGIREVFHARFVEHAYPLHTHETWTVCIVDAGAIRYQLDRHQRGAASSGVIVLPPDVVHSGRAADARGYLKRVVYLDTSLLGEQLIGRAVDAPGLEDAELRRSVEWLHALLESPDDALAAESQVTLVAERLRRHLTGHADHRAGSSKLAVQLRELLDAHAFENVTLASAGEILAASPTHLVRSFTRTFGISPHAYVLARRIEAARPLLLAGDGVADVAFGVGFYDQAHFTRHFKRHVGTTPASYAESVATS